MISEILTARNLDALYMALRMNAPVDDEIMTRLPTWGAAPLNTAGVWSWDETRLLVGTCASDVRIVARES